MKALTISVLLCLIVSANGYGIGFTHSIFAAHKKANTYHLRAVRNASFVKKIEDVNTENLKTKIEKASSTATRTVVGYIVDAIRK